MVRQRRTVPGLGIPLNLPIPQESLQPIGGGFFMTPTDAADPWDCDRYPDSPYCGGNPLGLKFSEAATEVVADECNIGVQITPSLGFIRLPTTQIVHRAQNCQKPRKLYNPPVVESTNELVSIPDNPCKSGIPIYIFYYRHTFTYEDNWNYDHASQSYIDINYSYRKADIFIESLVYSETGRILITIRYEVQAGPPFTTSTREEYYTPNFYEVTVTYDLYPGSSSVNHYYYDDKKENIQSYTIINPIQRRTDFTIYLGALPSWVYSATNMNYVRRTLTYQAARNIDLTRTSHVTPYREVNYSFDSNENLYVFERIQLDRRQIEIIAWCPNFFIDSPPPPKKKKCCMCCPSQEQNDALLKLILKKIGSANLPATVPKVLTDRSKGTTKIEDLATFISYTVKQLDALAGKYPIQIQVEDTNITQEGNQSVDIKLPNISETLAEIFGLLLVVRSESAAILSTSIRAMTEAGSAKQVSTLAFQYAKANAEYLAYQGKQTQETLPMTFRPGETKLDRMLQETQVSFKGWENADKDDLKDIMAPLLELAAMWKAQNFRQLGASLVDVALKLHLQNKGQESEKIDEMTNNKQEFGNFLEQVETGFTSEAGITDNLNPYGRDFKERPQIREIGYSAPTE